MIKKIEIKMDKNYNSVIKCGEKQLIVSIDEKVINSKDFFEILEYDIYDDFKCDENDVDITSLGSLEDKHKEGYRLKNYCIKLVKDVISDLNNKSVELRKKRQEG